MDAACIQAIQFSFETTAVGEIGVYSNEDLFTLYALLNGPFLFPKQGPSLWT